jgi:hypothetical protein
MDITNLDHLDSLETHAIKVRGLPERSSQPRLEGGFNISRLSYFRNSRSSNSSNIDTPLTAEEWSDLFCDHESHDGDSCSFEDFFASTISSNEGGYPQFRSTAGVGTLRGGIFSFSSSATQS